MTIHDYHETMKKVRVAELKARLSGYLRSVRRGHELTVYDLDQPIAKLVPYGPKGVLSVREPAAEYGKVADVPMPPPLRLDVDAVELLLEDRQSEA